MKRLWGLILTMLLVTTAGCGAKTSNEMPVLSEDHVFSLGTYTFTIPSGWYGPKSSEDSTTLFFYPSEGDGMISLASTSRIDLLDASRVAQFLSGYDASKEGVEEISLNSISSGTNFGIRYEYYDTYNNSTWYNTLYLMDAGNDYTAGILVAYPNDIPDKAKAQFDAVVEMNGLLENDFTQEPNPTETPTESPEATQNLADEMPTLGGLEIVDITLSLKNACGMPEGKWTSADNPSKQKEVISSYTVSNGCEVAYTIHADWNAQVSHAIFDIYNASFDPNDFAAYAASYLGFCATVPYDTAQASEARAWVEESITAAMGGDTVETTFGTGQYKLYGGNAFATLEISAEGREDYLLKVMQYSD